MQLLRTSLFYLDDIDKWLMNIGCGGVLGMGCFACDFMTFVMEQEFLLVFERQS